MNILQEQADAISRTLQTLNITSDYDTMNKLLGCIQLLGSMKDTLGHWQPIPQKVEGQPDDATATTD